MRNETYLYLIYTRSVAITIAIADFSQKNSIEKLNSSKNATIWIQYSNLAFFCFLSIARLFSAKVFNPAPKYSYALWEGVAILCSVE